MGRRSDGFRLWDVVGLVGVLGLSRVVTGCGRRPGGRRGTPGGVRYVAVGTAGFVAPWDREVSPRWGGWGRGIVIYVYAYMSLSNILLSAALAAIAASAQAPPNLAAGPTTRVLAVGHIAPGATREKVMAVMQKEVRDTVRLYLAGKLDQWFVRRDQNGVVFLLNVSTVEEAHDLLEKLPLGEAKLMEFDLIPLGPLTPLSLLLQEPKSPPEK